MGGKKLLKQAWTWVQLQGSHMFSSSAAPLAPVFSVVSIVASLSTLCIVTLTPRRLLFLTFSIPGAFHCQGSFRDTGPGHGHEGFLFLY